MRVFLSYRRDDSGPRAGRLRDALAARFGDDNIFQDVVAIAPGDRFDDAIDSALRQCDASIAVIGPGWISAVDARGQPRLTNTDDYVRRELAKALSRATPTIPVLVGGALMPTAEQLPPELRQLALRQAIALRDETWHSDIERLVRALPGSPGSESHKRWLLVTFVASVVVLALAVAVSLSGGDANSDLEATTAKAPTTDFDPYTAELPDCPSPQPPDWIDMDMTAQPTQPTSDAEWIFEVVGGFRRDGGTDEQDIIVNTRATRLAPGSAYHYPFCALVVAGDRYNPTCDSILGLARLNPGEVGDALIGFTEPPNRGTRMTLEAVDQSFVYRLDVTAVDSFPAARQDRSPCRRTARRRCGDRAVDAAICATA